MALKRNKQNSRLDWTEEWGSHLTTARFVRLPLAVQAAIVVGRVRKDACMAPAGLAQAQVQGLMRRLGFIVFVFSLLLEEEQVAWYLYSGRRIRRKPPCVTQGAGDRPGGTSPPKNPLARFAQQELPCPWGHWLVGLPHAQAGMQGAACTAGEVI